MWSSLNALGQGLNKAREVGLERANQLANSLLEADEDDGQGLRDGAGLSSTLSSTRPSVTGGAASGLGNPAGHITTNGNSTDPAHHHNSAHHDSEGNGGPQAPYSPAKQPPVAAGMQPSVTAARAGMGHMTTSMFSHLTSATALVQKVATHVVGGDDAGGGPQAKVQRSQVDMLKEQLIQSSQENDSLAKENEVLTAQLVRLKQQQRAGSRDGGPGVGPAPEGSVGALQQELSNAQGVRKQLEQQLAQLKRELEDSQGSVAERDTFWIKEMEGERSARRDVEGQVQHLQAQLERMQQQQQMGLGGAVGAVERSAAPAASAELAGLQAELAESREQLQVLQAQHTTLQSAQAARGQQHQAAVDGLKAQLAAAQQALQAPQQRLEQLEQQLAVAEQVAGQQRDQLAQLEQQLATALEGAAEPQQRLVQLEQQLAAAQQAAEAPQLRLVQLEQQLAAAQEAAGDAHQQLAQLQQQLASAQQAADAPQQRLAQVEQQLAAAQQAAGDAQSLASQLEQQLVAADQVSAEQREQVQQLEQQLAASQQEVAEARVQASRLEQQVAMLQDQLAAAREQPAQGQTDMRKVLSRVRDSDGSDVLGGVDEGVDVSQRVQGIRRSLRGLCSALKVEHRQAGRDRLELEGALQQLSAGQQQGPGVSDAIQDMEDMLEALRAQVPAPALRAQVPAGAGSGTLAAAAEGRAVKAAGGAAEEVVVLQARVAELEGELRVAGERAAAVEEEVAAGREALEAAEVELEALRGSDAGRLREQVDMLKELCEDERGFTMQARSELQEVQAKLQLAQQQAASSAADPALQQELQVVQQELAAARDELQTASALASQLAVAQEELATAKDLAAQTLEELAAAREQLDAATALAERRLEEQRAQQEAAQQELAAATAAAVAAAAAAQGASRGAWEEEELLAQVSKAESNVAALEVELAASRAVQEQQVTQIRALEQELSAQQSEASQSLASASEQFAAKVALLQQELELARSDLNTTRNDLESSSAELESSQAQLESTRSKLQSIRSHLESTCSELESTRSELDSSRSELEVARSDLASAQAHAGRLEMDLRLAGGQQAAQADEALKERDAFWKAELVAKGTQLAEAEARVRAASDAATRDSAAAAAARLQIASLQEELAHAQQTAAALAGAERGLRDELDAALGALEAQQRAGAAGAEHEAQAEEEVAAFRADAARHAAEARRLTGELQQREQQLAAAHARLAGHQDALDALDTATRRAATLQQQLDAAHEQAAAAAPAQQTTSAVRANSVDAGQEAGNDSSESVEAVARQLADVSAELEEAQAALEAGEAERERLRVQLSRLKEQMLREQDDEDHTLAERVDHEVRAVKAAQEALLAREREAWAQRAAREREQLTADKAALQAELQGERERAQQASARLQQESGGWEEALQLKEREVANLQAALGELTWESEAAERLRLEVRTATTRVTHLATQLEDAQRKEREARAVQGEAEHRAAQATAAMGELRLVAQHTSQECGMLRHALDAAMAQVQSMSSESGSSVDKRIVAKLLVTYFDKNCSRDVLVLMARMLNMSAEEQQRIMAAASKRGLLSRVAGAPMALGRALVGGGGGARSQASGETLADQWVQFLLSQAEREGAAAAEADGSAGAMPGGVGSVAEFRSPGSLGGLPGGYGVGASAGNLSFQAIANSSPTQPLPGGYGTQQQPSFLSPSQPVGAGLQQPSFLSPSQSSAGGPGSASLPPSGRDHGREAEAWHRPTHQPAFPLDNNHVPPSRGPIADSGRTDATSWQQSAVTPARGPSPALPPAAPSWASSQPNPPPQATSTWAPAQPTAWASSPPNAIPQATPIWGTSQPPSTASQPPFPAALPSYAPQAGAAFSDRVGVATGGFSGPGGGRTSGSGLDVPAPGAGPGGYAAGGGFMSGATTQFQVAQGPVPFSQTTPR